MMVDGGLTDGEREMLELLAGALIPPDEADEGIRGAGFAGIIELRNMYQPLTADLYRVGLAGCQEACTAISGKTVAESTEQEIGAVLAALANGTAVGRSWTDVCTPRRILLYLARRCLLRILHF